MTVADQSLNRQFNRVRGIIHTLSWKLRVNNGWGRWASPAGNYTIPTPTVSSMSHILHPLRLVRWTIWADGWWWCAFGISLHPTGCPTMTLLLLILLDVNEKMDIRLTVKYWPPFGHLMINPRICHQKLTYCAKLKLIPLSCSVFERLSSLVGVRFLTGVYLQP